MSLTCWLVILHKNEKWVSHKGEMVIPIHMLFIILIPIPFGIIFSIKVTCINLAFMQRTNNKAKNFWHQIV